MNKKESTYTSGLVCGFVGATLWGLSSVCSEYLMSAFAFPPLLLIMVRMVVATVCFLGYVRATCWDAFVRMLREPGVLRSVVIFGVVGLFSCQATYILSINATNAAIATIMQSLNIVIIPVVTWLFLKGKLHWGEKLGAVLAFASVVAIATQGNLGVLSMPLAGLVWGLLNGASEAFYVMYPSKLFERFGSIPVTAAGMLFAAVAGVLVWGVAALVNPAGGVESLGVFATLDAWGWLSLFGVCVVGTFVAFALFLRGVAIVGPVTSSLLGAMEPAGSAIFCALLLGTAFTGWDLLGMVLMIGTIFLVTLTKR